MTTSPADAPSAPLRAAVEAMAAGDATGLAELLTQTPELVHARWPGAETPYEGYFHRATLLHHVSGNPLSVPVAATAVALAQLLLERGADVDAATEPGPAQPNDIGWTTLGLVATSAAAREAGQQEPLMELLVARGADVGARNGGGLMGALYYGELDAARWLVERGADVDLVAAAGLGRLDLVERHLDSHGPTPDAHRLVHYSQIELPEQESASDVLALALCYAVKLGHRTVAKRLVAAGADVNARPPFDHHMPALHWAVLGDQPQCVRWLVEHGVDRQATDRTYGSTALVWAEVLKRDAVAALLR